MENICLKRSCKGFTLIELLITIAIIGIIASIAVPSYMNYTRRAYYSELVRAIGPYKVGIVECVHDKGALTGCNGGSDGIPDNRTTAIGGVASVTVSNGITTVVPVAQHGILSSDTYILTPTLTDGILTWKASGGGVTAGYAK